MNFLFRPVIFLQPDLTVDYSAWNGLIPFAFWLVDAIKPRILVELGTETGVSYCSFCQAISYLKIESTCCAVDTWQGDAHTGPYSPDIFRRLTDYHQPRYGAFSRLMRTTFDEAVGHFADGSIDLLHIDGYHTYDAVKHDFNLWLPKLSERGVILFHDTAEKKTDFGVLRFWEEIKHQYPSFSFLHSSGLGVLGVGSHLPEDIVRLTGMTDNETDLVRAFFAGLGVGVSSVAEVKGLETEVSQLKSSAAKHDDEMRQNLEMIEELRGQQQSLLARFQERERAAIESVKEISFMATQLRQRELEIKTYNESLSWRITRPLRIAKQAATRGTTERYLPTSGDDLHSQLKYCIDLFKLSGLRVSLTGWLFNTRRKISAIKLVACSDNDREEFDLLYGMSRPDVAAEHPFPLAAESGFRLGAVLLSAKKTFWLEVKVEGQQGDRLKIAITPQAVGNQEIALEGLAYSIDMAKIRGRRLRIAGWLFHEDFDISSLKLIGQTRETTLEFNVKYGIRRADIRNNHPLAYGKKTSAFGFFASGTLPPEQLKRLQLQIEFADNERQPIEIEIDLNKVEAKDPEAAVTFNDLVSLVKKGDSAPAPDGQAIAVSPGLQQFLNHAWASLKGGPQFTLIIDHNLGGGANRYRKKLVQDFQDRNSPVILLYYDLPKLEYVVECRFLDCELRVYPTSPNALIELVKVIGLKGIVLNNVYSYDEPLSITILLADLKRLSGAKITIAIHDFMSVCPSIHLLNEKGVFCDIPDISCCEKCLPSNQTESVSLIYHRNIMTWRSAWWRCLRDADSIVCFSESSRQLMLRAYPEITQDKIVTEPHSVDYLPNRVPLVNISGPLNIGVVGHINVYKGSAFIAELADCIQRRNLAATITVIGTLDQDLPYGVVRVTGPYEIQELPDLIESHCVNMFLLPSIVPETFSYVAEELMRLDVPLAVFDLGAPPERVAKYAKGLILREISADATLNELTSFQKKLSHEMTVAAEAKDPGFRPYHAVKTPKEGNVHVFTCAASNYLPKVRLLCNSIKQYHPEMKIHVALADRIPDGLDVSRESFDDVATVEMLDIPRMAAWIFGHNVIELSTAIKPFMLNRLLSRVDCDKVLYFDPDIVLFSQVDDLTSMLNTSNIILTPHLTKPESTLEAIRDNEICSMKHGIYNLGFIGVRNAGEGRSFAKWWADRLYYFCQEAIDQGLFTDQKWIDLVPAFFEGVDVVKSSRFNVAPWNLSTRKITGSFDAGFMVDGEPLGFYHFTGFDNGSHKAMAMKYASGNYAVSDLIDWYGRSVRNGSDLGKVDKNPWIYSRFSNGETISKTHRLIYRLRQDLQTAFPDPFVVRTDKHSYYHWFKNRAPVEYPEMFSKGIPNAK